jgi:hypothetical protein
LSHRASFTLDGHGDATDNGAIIDGATLDPTSLAIIAPFTSVDSVAQHRVLVSPHVD